ncbi:hypothetical protein GOZ96_04850 [Agrobacterium vitis]|uniref:Chromosomal replication initiator DnaA C-terminal domain-containing protein n=1 Tax=Agrobacterium vitis TaxID=373 RepID=A0A7J4X4G5_AGRVI|nr:helix-turn-helix domain-containing protein [Agrobacterium vitis]KAA3527068.1 hypothetical protein DXT89_14135 [Agrobacterium vitis]MUZ95918.1 hypothetical protein [Agrobacterium vitis]
MIQERQFTSAGEMMAAAAALRRKLFNPPNRKTEIVAIQEPKRRVEDIPMWEMVPTLFDSHVEVYHTHLRILEMVENGEIEYSSPARKTMNAIAAEVMKEYPEFTLSDLRSRRRIPKLCLAKHHVVYEIRAQRPDLSYPMIGTFMGGKDHTTVMHSYNKFKDMLEYRSQKSKGAA